MWPRVQEAVGAAEASAHPPRVDEARSPSAVGGFLQEPGALEWDGRVKGDEQFCSAYIFYCQKC